MPHEGYTDPITNDGPTFHSDIPVSELVEHNTRAIEASVVSSTSLVAETTDGMTHKTQPIPTGLELPGPYLGTRPTAHVAVGTDMSECPDRKEHRSP